MCEITRIQYCKNTQQESQESITYSGREIVLRSMAARALRSFSLLRSRLFKVPRDIFFCAERPFFPEVPMRRELRGLFSYSPRPAGFCFPNFRPGPFPVSPPPVE